MSAKVVAAMLTCNQLDLTIRAIHSLWDQDMPCEVFVYDNGSTDGTQLWLESEGISHICGHENRGITHGWNVCFDNCFRDGADFVFLPNNDTFMPPWFIRSLVSYNVPLVTGFEVVTMKELQQLPSTPLVPYPDFSAFMLRRDAWEKVGRFDERMFNYCSDCDYHVRAHRIGIDFWKANVTYYHERSSTLNLAPPDVKAKMHQRADQDREVFQSIYGCLPGTKDYLALLDLG